jgi:hypothetical protein
VSKCRDGSRHRADFKFTGSGQLAILMGHVKQGDHAELNPSQKFIICPSMMDVSDGLMKGWWMSPYPVLGIPPFI